MSERNEDTVRDQAPEGDVGERSHSAFARDRDGEPAGSDDRLGMRGRRTGAGEDGLLDDLDADRAREGGGA